ncbi:MAG: 2-succinyl-5-enolpyruvyl-6-hydroxy-3-cyclohexene-1-carboxylic-acid synthase [Gammaproteobacteria bacterium]|nr:MAG: 2-succinyl-5-enolpyruvyl-6-hydroxy-3-cyclohexene-1-carboxylic-acid synthase [Gammaproteobacteria bacterium]
MAESSPAPNCDLGTLNLNAATALLQGLVEGGVRRAVLSPGSRSSPLALAAHHCPDLETTMIVDERSAAFYALGQARAGGGPVAVVATSGTASANWHPAVIEASMDNVPLILVSADRPAELLQTGENQTIDQRRLFGTFPRDFIELPPPGDVLHSYYVSVGRRAADKSQWPLMGPVHINAAFREPLLPADAGDVPIWPQNAHTIIARPEIKPSAASLGALAARISGQRGVIVCGRGSYPSGFPRTVCDLAAQLECPIIADPLSGLRWGRHRRDRILTAADIFMRRDGGLPQPAWVLQFGGVPTSRTVQGWLGRIGAALLPVVPAGDWPEPSRSARAVIHSDPLPLAAALLDKEPDPAPEDWAADWQSLDAAGRELVADDRYRPPEADLVQVLEHSLPDGAWLFVGSSMPIRSVDAFSRGREHELWAIGNRGASGIDGCVSTVAGMTSCRPGSFGLVGDLALCHDMNGLLPGRDVVGTLIVVNNGGGGIFGLLPHRERPEFEQLWRTPTGLQPEKMAVLFDLPYATAAPDETLAQLLTDSNKKPGMRILEVRVDAELSWERHKALWQAAANL